MRLAPTSWSRIGSDVPAARSRSPFRAWVGGLCALFLLLTVIGPSVAEAGKLKVGKKPPELTWQDTEGNPVSWTELRAEGPMVVVFWATWCTVCRKDWPKLKKLATLYEESELPPVWASVSLGEPAERVARVAKKYELPGHILVDPKEVNGKKLGVEFVPEVCVLDASGRVAYYGAPKVKKINKVLAEITVAPKETE